jgi:urease accessory protein
MMRAIAVLPARSWDIALCVGTVVLDHDHRHRRRIALETEAGVEFLLDLPQAALLRDGDGLALDTGGVVRVCAMPEPLFEIDAADDRALLSIAWHLGNRHLPVQVVDRRLRIRADHVIADLVRRLGGEVAPVAAPFDPEPGAYAGGHHHDHDAEPRR